MKIIKDIKLNIDEEEVLRYQGYSKSTGYLSQHCF